MIELPWGDDVLSIPLPAGWRLLGTYAPRATPPAPDPEALCRSALARPHGAAPLADRDLRGKRVLIVADDRSRPTPIARFFRPVREALVQAGAEPEQIEILFALGMHRPMTVEEAAAKIGPDNLAAHRWHNPDGADASQLVRLGVTSRGTTVLLNRRLTQCDLIVALGVIEPHPLLGFSGGLKAILPGCAAAETIGRNHLQGMIGPRFDYVGAAAKDSPMRLDLEEGAGMLRQEVFLVNAALNPDAEIIGFFCGCPRAAFRAGAEFVRRQSAVAIPEPADVVLTNSRPFDADLRQGLKCIGNTLAAARPGGLILGCLYCMQGVGDLRLPPWTLPYPVLRRLLRSLGPRPILCVGRWRRRKELVEEQFLEQFGLRLLHRNHVWFFSDRLGSHTGKKLGALRQFATVAAIMAAAERQAGPKASVAVFPFGGATYPILSHSAQHE